MRIDVSTHIAASPEDVTAVLLDADLAPLWTSDLEYLEVVRGEPGQAGCVGWAHYRQGSKRYVLEDVLVEAIPNRRYRSRISGEGVVIEVQTELEPTDGGTEVRLQWESTSKNPLMRVFAPVLRRAVERRAASDLEALGALVERSDG